MSLPKIALPTDVVVVAGDEISVRGLSRAEVLRIAKYQGDPDAAENFILACGLDESESVVREWRESIPAGGDVDLLVDRVCQLSGLTEGAQKSN